MTEHTTAVNDWPDSSGNGSPESTDEGVSEAGHGSMTTHEQETVEHSLDSVDGHNGDGSPASTRAGQTDSDGGSPDDGPTQVVGKAADDKATSNEPDMLSSEHRKMLSEESGISNAMIEARGYRTVTVKTRLKELGFSEAQCKVPAILVPVHSPAGGIATYQTRPDAPRIKDGKPVKYETPHGSRMALDVNPSGRDDLDDPSVPLFVTEGVKKGDALASQDLAAVALLGVWNWRGTNDKGGKIALPEWDDIALNDRQVYIVFDSDVMLKPAVYNALVRLKGFLESRKAIVAVVYLPPTGNGGKQGVDDFLAAGKTPADLMALATPDVKKPPKDEGEGAISQTQSATLVQYAAQAELFHTADDTAYMTVPTGAPDTTMYKTFPVDSAYTKSWLRNRYYKDTKAAPNAQALSEAIGSLVSQAQFDGPEREVYVRTAKFGGKIYIDLANDAGEVVEIDENGWRIVSDPPVRFRRPSGVRGMPRPVRGGDLEELRRFLNVGSDDDWRLISAWLIQAIWPTGSYPILILQGEQGSAKSTTAKILKRIGDPSATAVRATPRNQRDLIIAANNSQISSFDNLSGLQQQMSDALCQLSTGGGFATRKHYANDEETIFDVMRPVILNGISGISTRADLLDRSLVVELPCIDHSKRVTESELWTAIEEAHPRILGALFDAMSGALRDLPNTKVTNPPRMADFANLATAAERALGWERGAFMESFDRARKELDEYALEADPLASGVLELMSDRLEWIGTTSELLEELNDILGDEIRRYKTWPKHPQHLSNWLKRSAPVLRAEGIEYENLARSGNARKKRIYRITSPDEQDPERSSSPEVETNAEPLATPSYSGTPAGVAGDVERDTRDAHDGELQTFGEPHLVETPDVLQKLVKEVGCVDTIALDLETTGLDPRNDKVRLISLSTQTETWVVDCLRVDPATLLDALSGKKLVIHNAAFDLGFLLAMGFELGTDGEVVDTMLMSQVVGIEEPNGKDVS